MLETPPRTRLFSDLHHQVVIEFAANYTLPEITVTGYSGVEIVAVREITKGIDSISYLGDGRCEWLSSAVRWTDSFLQEVEEGAMFVLPLGMSVVRFCLPPIASKPS